MTPQPSTSPARTRPRGRQVLADSVHDWLLEALMDGTYEAGAALNIDGIARDFDVSPTPVREALARLESTGLVQRVALRGYRVAAPFTDAEHAELVEARLAIETACSFLFHERHSDDDITALRAAIDAQRAAPRGATFADFRDYYEADERFHRIIASGSGNRFLVTAYEALGGHLQRFRLFGGSGITDADAALAEHEAILAAMIDGDRDAAAAAMDAHLCGVRDRSAATTYAAPSNDATA